MPSPVLEAAYIIPEQIAIYSGESNNSFNCNVGIGECPK
jgi:hypothetical protein